MIEIFCDGSSTGRSNREGGWAYVIVKNGVIVQSGSGGHPSTTNNVMELTGAIEGLLALDAISYRIWEKGEPVVLVSDSRYVLGMARGMMVPTKNLEQVVKLRELYDRLCTETRWVRGHSGDFFNEFVDKLAKTAKGWALEENVVDRLWTDDADD